MDVLMDIEEEDPQEKMEDSIRWDGQEQEQKQGSNTDTSTSGDDIDPIAYSLYQLVDITSLVISCTQARRKES